MRVVVTGGTGFVGTALTEALVARGDEVVVFTRGESRKTETMSYVKWTPQKAGAWQESIDGVDAVVHLTGAGVMDERWSAERKKVLVASRVESTRLVVDAISKARRKPRVFVSCSAVGYYGTKTEDEVLDESAPNGSDFLAGLVRAWEDAAKGAGVRTVFPRIGLVLGKDGGVLGKMVPLFRAFVGGPLGNGKQFMPWIHIRDLVRAFEHLIEREDASGAYNLTGPEPVTMNEFTSLLGKALGRPSLMRAPETAVRLMLGESAETVLTGQRAVPKRLIESGFAFVFPDLASALADLV